MKASRRRLLTLGPLSCLLFALSGSRPTGRPLALPLPKPERIADIVQFGAVGDGGSDAAPAIQAALDSGATVIHFPAGSYALGRPLQPRSGQTWRGDGSASTRLFLPETDAAPYNMVQTRASLEQLSFSGLEFMGNRTTQKRPSQDGQAPFGLYLRGGCRDIEVRECLFHNLGNSSRPMNKTGGGGIVLGAIPDAQDQTLEDIRISRCEFRGNGNVPGIYIGGGNKSGFKRRNISITDNSFEGVPDGTRAQNCIYILSESAYAEIGNVTIANNRFYVDSMVDALIELNWVRAFTISGNSGIFDSALSYSTAILVRDGCFDGAISGNSFVNRSGVDHVAGIMLVNFADPGEILGVSITGNSLRGFSRAAIAVDRGSRNVVVQGNQIEGPGTAGIRIAAASNALVANNLITSVDYGILLAARTPGGATSGIQITNNRITDSGGDGRALIDVEGDKIDIRGLLVTGNTVFAPRVGTRALVAGHFLHPEGNKLAANHTTGLAVVAEAERTGFESIRLMQD